MATAQDMYQHFQNTASTYREARTTDPDVIDFIAEKLKHKQEIKMADIGCGTGRYDLLLFEHLKNLNLTCIDVNAGMLQQLSEYLMAHKVKNFQIVQSEASDIPLADHSMDAIVTFNAVHHFNFDEFIQKCWQALKGDGTIFIYTRLRSQNANNIWGRYFPSFSERETRLYELNEMEASIRSSDVLQLAEIKRFQFHRNSTLERLVDQANAKHYSTFSLYTSREFSESLNAFQDKITTQFPDTQQLEWVDENILLVLQPR